MTDLLNPAALKLKRDSYDRSTDVWRALGEPNKRTHLAGDHEEDSETDL